MKEEKYLTQMFQSLGLIGLPEKEDKDQIWVYALCLVEKSNARQEYVVVRHDIDDHGNESLSVIKDYGTVAAIVKMGEIYPYEYVTYIPRVPLKTEENIAAYIAKTNQCDIEIFKDMDKDKLMMLLKKTLIENHIKTSK